MEEQIINNSSIWDLHIHTCECSKSSGEFKKLDVTEYVDKLVELFKKHKKLKMISFTDHNQISYKVYEEFEKRKTGIELIPGIEIDVNISGIKKAKHLIFYFNLKIDELESFSNKLNDKLENIDSIDIHEILEFIITEKIEFIISPHAFKQGHRGIDYDWNDFTAVQENAHKYVDQFFCFWETSGLSSIMEAVKFLKEFEIEEKISIVSFSDSSDFEKLEKYLQEPPHYFLSLASFKGLQLAGTDNQRIVKDNRVYDISNSGNLVYAINIEGQKIYLSDRLNAIVGGRGSGKSILLDNIAISLDDKNRKESIISKDRLSFLDSINMELFNNNYTKILPNSKKIDFFDQAYVTKIFSHKDTSKEIESYFKDEFSALEELSVIIERDNFKKLYLDYLEKTESSLPESNVTSLIERYKIIDDDEYGLKVSSKNIKEIDLVDYDVAEAYKQIRTGYKIIPKNLKSNNIVNNKVKELLLEILSQNYQYNKNNQEIGIESRIKTKCNDLNELKNKNISLKNSESEKFLNNLKSLFIPYIQRVNIINAMINLDNEYMEMKDDEELNLTKETYTIKKSIEENIFKFERKIIFERPLLYFQRKCLEYMGTDIKKMALKELFNTFIYNFDSSILSSKSSEKLLEELKELKDYDVKLESNILFGVDEENLDNLKILSPGTQTNILMEYIVSKDTEIPLLIDQPEDNIDNETIYHKLTTWFKTLKMKRQVIVVTHDANIVINSDAENVIIATKNTNNEFVYDFGALEYADNLKRISIILDGGIDAVERRLKKYGK